MAYLFPGGTLKNAKHTSPGNPVEFVYISMHQMFSQRFLGMISEAEPYLYSCWSKQRLLYLTRSLLYNSVTLVGEQLQWFYCSTSVVVFLPYCQFV